MKIKLTFLLLCFSCLTVMADNEDENGIDSIDYATEANAMQMSAQNATQMSMANATQIQEQTFEFDTDYLSHIYGKSSDAESVNSELSSISSVVLTAPELLSAQTTEPGFLKTIFNKELANEKYGVYTPLKEFEWTTVPLVAFGFIAKGNKKNFRAARNNFIPSYKNRFDDNLQLVPVGVSTILNVAGYQGRSKTGRYFANTALSYAWCALFVNSIKYTAKEMRPDGSTANSFPSGHTATAFTAATILHKEYGLTRSPWWSILGYGCATTTGIMRTLNNRHWISDVLVGAGIGVISTDLGYMIGDMIFKKKGINREPRKDVTNLLENSSFFRLELGMQFNNKIKLPTECSFLTMANLYNQPGASSMEDDFYTIQRKGNPFRIPDSYDVESSKRTYKNYASGKPAYAEGVTPTIKVAVGTTVGAEAAYFFNKYIGLGARARITTAPVTAEGLYCYEGNKLMSKSASASDVWAIADASTGIYLSLPFSAKHNVGVKALYGRRFFGELDLTAAYDEVFIETATGDLQTVTFYGDNLNIKRTNTDNFALGMHYTYAMNSGVALSAFVDYDYAKPEFSVSYTPYNSDITKMIQTSSQFSFKNKINSLTLGASMTVLF